MRILFAPETFNLGETSRAVEVARAVKEAGHEVLFMGYSRRFADYVAAAGFDLELLPPELSEADADRLIAVDQGRAVRHPFTVSMVRERVASELDLMGRWHPDAIVIGTTMTLFISARAAGVPLVHVRPYAMSRAHLSTMRRLPLLTGTGPLAAAGNRLAGTAVRTAMNLLRWKPRSFRLVAAEHGVRLPDRTLDALDADLNLIASSPSVVDDSTLADNEILVGPIYAKSEAELPADIRALTERTRPVVYVGLGSSAGRSLAMALLRQLSGLDLDIVTTAGNYLRDADRASLPSNVRVHDFLPAHRLARLVDAAVIHGGEGTVQTACASGVPFAGIGLQFEQRLNIDACVRHGNALRFTASDVRRKRLPAIVHRLLTEDGLRDAARELGQPASRTDGARSSAARITEFI